MASKRVTAIAVALLCCPAKFVQSSILDYNLPMSEKETPKPPKTTSYSDIDLNRWREYDNILTDSLWLFPNRMKRGGHQLDYHGNFIPQIATQLFERYTKQDEIVLDLFLGAGTSALEAANLSRRLVGVELKSDLVTYVKDKIPPDLLNSRIKILQGDSARPETLAAIKAELTVWKQQAVQFLVLHPPYADIIKFSDRPDDLSNSDSIDGFLDRFQTIARQGFELLAPGRFAALIIGDKYAGGELIPLGFWCMERMNQVGFRTKAIIVKDIQGNERGKGRTSNLWRYRALAGGYYIFKHEYIIVMVKPASRKR